MRDACCGDVSVDMAISKRSLEYPGGRVVRVVESGRVEALPGGVWDGSVCDPALVIICSVFGFFLGDMRQ
jgi:hypothetical protein